MITFATTSGTHVPYLDSLRGKSIYTQFYDPDGDRHGLPTSRQLRARGLRPGGQRIAAQILWRHRKRPRVAYLYREDLAKPKRTATPAQLIAIGKALRARRTCPACRQEKDYYIPRSLGECNDCHDRWAA